MDDHSGIYLEGWGHRRPQLAALVLHLSGVAEVPGVKNGWGHSAWDLQLASVGIDDLTKFRIVQFLCQSPGSTAEAGSLAATLGFHSVAQTEIALRELATQGILHHERPPASNSHYTVAVDSQSFRRATAVLQAAEGSPEYGLLLQGLARRSLSRARAWAERGTQRVAAAASDEPAPGGAIGPAASAGETISASRQGLQLGGKPN